MVTPRSIVTQMKPGASDTFDPEAFIKKYEEVYLSSSNRSGWKKKKTFSPSQLGYGHGTCPRYWYVAFSGADFVDEVDSKGLANMDNGTYAHERVQSTIEKMGILREKELEVLSQDPPIRGFVDIVIDWEGKLIPGEFKTTNDMGFTWRKTTGKPPVTHYIQFIIYLKVLDADEGFLLYENKDNQEMAIIPLRMNETNEKYVDYLFDWMRETYKAFDEETLPTNPFNRRKNAKICNGCPVKKDCFDMDKFGIGEVDLPLLKVPKL
jgi:CRISPR/Cas system-associated exonuclease Cas4 (RecB family)